MLTRWLKTREHTHRRRHISTMETINELTQVDRQVVVGMAAIQVATQIITIELAETVKSAHYAMAQKRHKDFL